ncbi:acetoacetyl-CoA reductase [Aquicella lusitana]|uniref:3-oxoacyl-[acyl-carrier-protein] reductase n=1 Tax=Aquicella lusitana TaxID=254246 RepID=A0A370G584_9COXI|nr:acetoacetyl-CoA reductase [Aquicella lusitana]RDI38962.1 3-oxoacyl-[acyl-carrier-protein] reductase [Aquicella lusitana]VVC74289.1 Acetoacetyl-CoA reductase [Aquicella lusitana]
MAKRIAIVTGGMGGIGQAICRVLHDQDIHVIATYNRGGNHAAAQSWQNEQQKAGYHFDIAYVDVTDFQSCQNMVNQVQEKTGPIDILVNNAGITRDSSCCKMNREDWDIVINTDLNSVFYVTRATINSMKERKYGRIINISSINGQKGQFGQVNYSAAKAGMHGFTKALALEVAKKGITVNTISPGYVATDMIMSVPDDIRNKILGEIPMGRFANPDEVAHVVAFLVDDKSSYITGTNIAINGGHYML